MLSKFLLINAVSTLLDKTGNQKIIKTHSNPDKNSLWPVYWIFSQNREWSCLQTKIFTIRVTYLHLFPSLLFAILSEGFEPTTHCMESRTILLYSPNLKCLCHFCVFFENPLWTLKFQSLSFSLSMKKCFYNWFPIFLLKHWWAINISFFLQFLVQIDLE